MTGDTARARRFRRRAAERAARQAEPGHTVMRIPAHLLAPAPRDAKPGTEATDRRTT